jgi:hypothetical protein
LIRTLVKERQLLKVVLKHKEAANLEVASVEVVASVKAAAATFQKIVTTMKKAARPRRRLACCWAAYAAAFPNSRRHCRPVELKSAAAASKA